MEPVSAAAALVIPAAIAYAAWRRAYLSLTLSFAIMVLFAATYLTASPIGWVLTSPLARDLVLRHAAGSFAPAETWTAVTAMFMHLGTLHLLFNLLTLVLIGTPLEERIGTLRWGLLFFLGGLFGTFLFLILHWNESFFLLGASGAISSILGAFGRLYPRDRIMLFLLPVAVPAIWVVIGFLLLSTLLALLTPGSGIAHEAHVGGVVFGFAFAPLAMRLRGPQRAVVSGEGLRGLATTPELEDALAHIEGADEPDVRAAWVERFAERVRCPRCGGPVVLRGNRLRSDCGWTHDVAGRKA